MFVVHASGCWRGTSESLAADFSGGYRSCSGPMLSCEAVGTGKRVGLLEFTRAQAT